MKHALRFAIHQPCHLLIEVDDDAPWLKWGVSQDTNRRIGGGGASDEAVRFTAAGNSREK